ncbi:hypothetical protein AOQ84DRAFT_44893 [Glonium stellatum]|uniref:Uncharacterized protein n=1 Tax=Glonium stellatum TaxID=574774 RepID=A0A8E2JSQ9_9PEZI|nr:hypothetical protein AOQ84DRAFT_44893 [Glonium stellatum]
MADGCRPWPSDGSGEEANTAKGWCSRLTAAPSRTMSAHHDLFMHNCVFRLSTPSARHQVVRPPSDAPASQSPNMQPSIPSVLHSLSVNSPTIANCYIAVCFWSCSHVPEDRCFCCRERGKTDTGMRRHNSSTRLLKLDPSYPSLRPWTAGRGGVVQGGVQGS